MGSPARSSSRPPRDPRGDRRSPRGRHCRRRANRGLPALQPLVRGMPDPRTYLVELDRHGHLVPGFGSELPTRRLGGVLALTIGPEGDVFVAGKGGLGSHLARFDRHGHLDPSFGTGGMVLSRSTLGARLGPSKVEALALTDEGRIVVAGSTELTAKTRSALFAARYLHDGRADLSFGRDGQSAIARSKRGARIPRGSPSSPAKR